VIKGKFIPLPLISPCTVKNTVGCGVEITENGDASFSFFLDGLCFLSTSPQKLGMEEKLLFGCTLAANSAAYFNAGQNPFRYFFFRPYYLYQTSS
jgi:hypothetical protein